MKQTYDITEMVCTGAEPVLDAGRNLNESGVAKAAIEEGPQPATALAQLIMFPEQAIKHAGRRYGQTAPIHMTAWSESLSLSRMSHAYLSTLSRSRCAGRACGLR